jgi:putative FmdB family regulatory protein
MPLYEYKCLDGHTFEKIEELHAAIINCPDCGELANRQLSVPYLKTETGVKQQ